MTAGVFERGGAESAPAGVSRWAGGSDGFASGLRVVESERRELEAMVRQLAEAQIARARTEMENAANARLEARRRELYAWRDRELSEGKARIAGVFVGRIRECEAGLQAERANLRLKLAALESRRGLFGGKQDGSLDEQRDRLAARLEQLDKQRAESVKSAQDLEARETSELEKRLQDQVDAEIEKLRADLRIHATEQTRSIQDRLTADLSSGISAGAPAPVRRGSASANTISGADALRAVESAAATAAVRSFDQDLARASALARKRQADMGRRRTEDAAVTEKKRPRV